MRRAFLSGATGFLGRHMVDVLLEDGWEVVALCRSRDKARGIAERGVEVREGSLGSADSIAAAIPEGVDAVFHMAADTSTWRGDREAQFATNVDGTRNMLEAAKKRGAGRFIHTSTTAVYGHHAGSKTEELRQLGGKSKVGYVKSKWLAEQLVKKAAGEGLSTILLNPGHILGAYDTHNWARMFLMIQAGTLPGIPPGSGSFANAREVARAHLEAVGKGGEGENYLLGGPHHQFLDVVKAISALLGTSCPKRATPKAVLVSYAWVGDLVSRFTRKPPRLSPEEAYFLCNDDRLDSTKAKEVLGYREVPLEKSLRESRDWLVENGLLGG